MKHLYKHSVVVQSFSRVQNATGTYDPTYTTRIDGLPCLLQHVNLQQRDEYGKQTLRKAVKLFCDYNGFPEAKELTFDGTSGYLTVLDADAVDFGTGDFSICFWLDKTTTVATQSILDKGAATGGYTISVNNTRIAMLTIAVDVLTYNYISTTTAIPTGFCHICFTVDRDGNAKVYINGILDTTKDLSNVAASIDTALNFLIGKTTGSANYMTGKIDHIRLYKKNLSATEVTTIFNGGVKKDYAVADAGAAAAAWNCNEQTGTTITDEIGGLVGTITGGVTWVAVSETIAESDRVVVADGRFAGTYEIIGIEDAGGQAHHLEILLELVE